VRVRVRERERERERGAVASREEEEEEGEGEEGKKESAHEERDCSEGMSGTVGTVCSLTRTGTSA